MVNFLKNFKKEFLFAFILSALSFQHTFAQTEMLCKVDGDDFKGKVEDAVQVSIGSENFIQIKSVDGDHILYMYIKTSKLSGGVPVTLNFKDHDPQKGEMPDAEVVWVPDGPDKPQWNSVDGSLIVTQFDPAAKTISGTFEFKVEKFEYSSKAKDDRPSETIEEGKFNSLQYRIEENK